MGVTETMLVGIACVLSQSAGPEAEKIKQKLTAPERDLIEYMQKKHVCDELDRYIKKSENEFGDKIYLTGCGSCLMTSSGEP